MCGIKSRVVRWRGVCFPVGFLTQGRVTFILVVALFLSLSLSPPSHPATRQMQYIPGSSVTLSASLHALQHQPLPDDTSLQTRLPQICVDYLSHDWLEEDVWKSWRNMTRHKNEVTNGVRLENASWRTWWKQRNKLRTISPETLNWLKDSDVTWLYGPLHTAADPVPPPRQSTTEERFNLVNASGKKPILKHRTITDLLNVPFDSFPAAGSPALEAIGMDFSGSSTTDDSANSSMPGSPRPPLPHTKSDSYITRRGRKDSPPTIPGGAPDHPGARSNSSSPRQYPPFLSNNVRNNSGGSGNSHGSVSLAAPQPKKHISFNAFVQQCISIDKSASSDASSRYQTDSDIEDDTDFNSPNSSLIEMRRTPSFASGSSVSGGSIIRAPVSRSNSISSIHADKVTIAPIAPTVLKTSEELPAPSPAVRFVPPGDVDVSTLEYPPSTSSSPGSSGSSTPSETEDDDIAFLEGFVPPRWGRPSVPTGTVGTGAQGPAGPRDLFAEQAPSSPPQEFESPSTSPYRGERRHRHHHSSSPRSLGPMAGRSRWVGRVESDEDDESSGDGADADDSADDDGEFKRYRGHRRDEDGSMTASTTSDSTIVGNESSSSRRGILKTHPESEASSTRK
ncbi:hypothetical protein FRC02_003287 [Tulasnella sp. 418]|nr:hypothetical protein FRC02_003287 [Tulasnella sp. 418]